MCEFSTLKMELTDSPASLNFLRIPPKKHTYPAWPDHLQGRSFFFAVIPERLHLALPKQRPPAPEIFPLGTAVKADQEPKYHLAVREQLWDIHKVELHHQEIKHPSPKNKASL